MSTSEGQHMLDVLERKSDTRLRWFRHVHRRDSKYIGRRMMKLELPGRRPRGRPKRFMDVVKEDMKLVGVREENSEGNVNVIFGL